MTYSWSKYSVIAALHRYAKFPINDHHLNAKGECITCTAAKLMSNISMYLTNEVFCIHHMAENYCTGTDWYLVGYNRRAMHIPHHTWYPNV